ncbi:family 20 glycosylhydrolase [Streptomyces sp. SID8379]|uniref:family 20 glycosylhydrolase n=1 Tax=unclassified Streptomyces TaxID=2593676 RepID=UPI0005B9A689|nr:MULTISPECIES: family 20 glycosylhydrolase [unclassified Streptomyces]MYW63296.1 family 20 glycosylhydrolase [Streptomyces sp. SID8379]
MTDSRVIRAPRRRRHRWLGAAAALLLLTVPAPLARADAAQDSGPRTVPALTNWTAEGGRYSFGDDSRLVAADAASRRVARTLAGDLRAAGKGDVPVVGGPSRAGDIVVDVDPDESRQLGAEGYELTSGKRLEITGAAETGAFYGTRTLLQLLAQDDEIAAGHTVDVPRYKERGVGVCACYVHISTDWLENLVRDMAYHKLNQLLLELKVKSDAHPEANSWGYYTRSEIRRLVALGEKYHVTIVPEINSPGHIDPWIENRPDLQLVDTDGKAQPSRLDITEPEAFGYYKSLIDEYGEVFPAKWWHMGADEYMLGSDFAKYPHVLEYAKAKYGENATPQDAFIDFVNRVEAYAASKGKRLRIWNDGLTGANTVPVTPGTTVEHWLGVKVKPSQLIAQGHPVMNAAYSLYLVRGGFHTDTRKLYDEQWDPRSFEGEKLTSAKGITGAKISLWPDYGAAETENQVAESTELPLAHIAQVTWGAAHPDATYDAFAARAAAVTHAPGWRDLTRVPVADGTYTFTDTQRHAGKRQLTVTRTSDGYVTLTDPATGKCLETRSGKLTHDLPLEPGSAVTQEACDAERTLQRWVLSEVPGGHRLTNAITQMPVHVTDDGALVQYPADQRQAAVWRLTHA